MPTQPISTFDLPGTESDRSGRRNRRKYLHVDSDRPENDFNVEVETPRRTKRRKTNISPESDGDVVALSTSDSEGESSDLSRHTKKSARRTLSHISVCGPVFPRSCYEGWTPLSTPTDEIEAISDLKKAFDQQNFSEDQQPEYTIFQLDDFNIYRPNDHKSHACQLTSLDQLQGRGRDEYMFDGILSVAGVQRFVQGIRFGTLTVEGYGDAEVTDLSDRLCIQSKEAARKDVYYQLGRPSPEYRRFFKPFLWLAQFAKYYVDFLLTNKHVTLDDFRRNFYGWLFAQYSEREHFKLWLDRCNLRDFRTTVAAHIGFLYKECYSIDSRETRLLKHPIWGEVDPANLTAIPQQPLKEKQTIVTPFAYKCFRHMYFAEHLEPRQISHDDTIDRVSQRKRKLGLTPFGSEDVAHGPLTPQSMPRAASEEILDIAKGDVVRVRPDAVTRWKSSSSIWYAYVQAIRFDRENTNLDVIWLYEPSDTTLGAAFYPFSNELFFSDNCSCGKEAIDVSSIIDKADVSFFVADPTSLDGLFVRQTFRTIHNEDTYDFVSLKKRHFNCACPNRKSIFEECRAKFQIGDTVLYRDYNRQLKEERLELGQIVDFLLGKQRVLLRRFRRKTEIDLTAKANQVVVTKETVEKGPSTIIRHCQIRVFHPDVLREGLPVPYDQSGAGDLFFVLNDTENAAGANALGSIDSQEAVTKSNGGIYDMPPLPQSWNPNGPSPVRKLTGMGIFCGGGNLDRGLEDGGAVEFRYAIDIAKHALHTYRANAKHPERMQLFLGSVDDYLAQAMAGSSNSCIAEVGKIDVLAAGSPCPGFSQINIRKLEPRALRNCSMVASVVSYVDLYSPKYCFLENVVPMTRGMGPNKEENVFAQILAAFVALGYQVQQFLMDSWSFGSPQQRTRVFIVASAPGLEPLHTPPHTHDHPETGNKWRNMKLGKSSNGKPFGIRRDDYTPFDHVSPLEATKDLLDVQDSLAQLCPTAPDHRVPSEPDNLVYSCFAVVPTHPRGMGLVQAVQNGDDCDSSNNSRNWCSTITGQPREEYYEDKLNHHQMRGKQNSKVFARIYPDQLFPTLLTALQAHDCINGRLLHWDHPRTITVMEARRCQGLLDHEVVVGSSQEQIRILGNSVDRKVSLALGLLLRKSWLSNSLDHQRNTDDDTTDDYLDSSKSHRIPGEVSAFADGTSALLPFNLSFRHQQ